MIIREQGLIKNMRESYKGHGYSVAVSDDAVGVESIIIIAKNCVVVGDKKKMPRKVLALIVEHMGELPQPGEAYQIRKNHPQVEIFDVAIKHLKGMHADNKPLKVAKRTNLTMGGYQLWQRKDDLRIFRLDPVLENILELSRGIHRTVGDDVLMMEDTESRAYVYFEKSDKNCSSVIEHLSQMQLITM